MTRHIMRLPDLGEGLVSAEVVTWYVRVGDFIEEDQPLVEMSTDKAIVEIPSPVTGKVLSVAGKPGDVLAVGSELVVFEIDTASQDTPLVSPSPPLGLQNSVASQNSGTTANIEADTTHEPVRRRAVRASPATRRAARQAGVDLTSIAGTGPGGRILQGDLGQAHGPKVSELSTESSAASSAASLAEYDEIPVIGVRRVIAQRMSEAKRVAPHFAYVEEVDVTALEWWRQRANAERERTGEAPLSYLPYIARALVLALKEFPQCNAHYDEKTNSLRQYRAVHLGIATHTPQGLKVPVLRDAQRLRVADLAQGIGELATAAKEGRATRQTLTGSTITLTSLGKLGGLVSTPILNLPEVAIVGVNKAVERVVVHDGKIVIRRIMNLSSSFDHRFIDGYEAAAMIQRLKAMLEKPEAWAGD